MKRTSSLFLSLSTCLVCFGQGQKTIGLEYGLVINTPFVKQERFVSGADMRGSFDRTYTYHSSVGTYAKASFDHAFKSKTKWSLTMPVSLTYMNQITRYDHKGWY